MQSKLFLSHALVIALCATPVWAQPNPAHGVAPLAAQAKSTQPSPAIKVDCPVANVSVGVKSPGTLPNPWWDTPFAMVLDSTSLTSVSGAPGLRCLYRGSGREWDITRPVGPEYQSCTPSGKGFMCVPSKGY